MSSSDHEPMPFALFNIYLLLIHGVFPELAPLHRAGVMCFVGIYSKQLLFVAHFFFFLTKVWNRPPLDAMKIYHIY